MGNTEAGYSSIAEEQLDTIEHGDPGLYADLVSVCEDILDDPDRFRPSSVAITTHEGIRLRTPVAGRHPYKVFWSTTGPRIEAVFPYI